MKPVLFLLLAGFCAGAGAAQTPETWMDRALHATDLQKSGDRDGAATEFEQLEKDLRAANALDRGGPAIMALNALGVIYQDYGEYEKAERYYLNALRACSQTPAERFACSTEIIANLGAVYYDTRQLGQLRETCKKARRLLRTDDSPTAQCARLHHMLGLTERIDGRLDESEKELKRALAIWRSMPGDYKIQVGDSLNSLGTLQFDLEHYDLALQYFEQAIQCYGGHSAANVVAAASTNIALVYARMNRIADADIAFAEAVEKYRAAVGFDHPQLARIMLSYATVLEQVGERRRARDHRRRAESILAARESTAASKHVIDVVDLQGQ